MYNVHTTTKSAPIPDFCVCRSPNLDVMLSFILCLPFMILTILFSLSFLHSDFELLVSSTCCCYWMQHFERWRRRRWWMKTSNKIWKKKGEFDKIKVKKMLNVAIQWYNYVQDVPNIKVRTFTPELEHRPTDIACTAKVTFKFEFAWVCHMFGFVSLSYDCNPLTFTALWMLLGAHLYNCLWIKRMRNNDNKYREHILWHLHFCHFNSLETFCSIACFFVWLVVWLCVSAH